MFRFGSGSEPVRGHFHWKEVPVASWLAATGLVKSWVVIFTENVASWLAATGLVKSKGGHFRRKKPLRE